MHHSMHIIYSIHIIYFDNLITNTAPIQEYKKYGLKLIMVNAVIKGLRDARVVFYHRIKGNKIREQNIEETLETVSSAIKDSNRLYNRSIEKHGEDPGYIKMKNIIDYDNNFVSNISRIAKEQYIKFEDVINNKDTGSAKAIPVNHESLDILSTVCSRKRRLELVYSLFKPIPVFSSEMEAVVLKEEDTMDTGVFEEA
eukprot:925900_1